MGLLDQLWDDVLAGPPPSRGLGKLRKGSSFNMRSGTSLETRRMMEARSGGELSEDEARQVTKSITIVKAPYNRSLSLDTTSLPSSPTGSTPPASPSPHSATPRDRENVWRSVFNPGSNRATDLIGSDKFDKADPNGRTVYDWLYSDDTKSKYR